MRHLWVEQSLDLDRQPLDVDFKGDDPQVTEQKASCPGHFLDAAVLAATV
jgi:hypothetical protein